MNSIVITGGDGFIGSNLCRYLSCRNYQVYALVVPNSKNRHKLDHIPNVIVVEGCLEISASIITALPRNPIAFIHLAWDGVSPEARESTEMQASNIALALSSVRLANAIGSQRFIFPGSTMEYAYCGQIINYNARPSPMNAYGAAKISTRYMCEALCEEFCLPFIYVVITGIYGAGRNDNNIISYTITELLAERMPRLTKLEQLWDYVHINDVMHAFSLIVSNGKGNSFYCIGHGDNWPLINYITIIRDLIDPNLPLGIGKIPYKNNLIPSSCVDLTSIHNDVGYKPEISFEVGIKDVIAQFRKGKIE